MNLSVKTFVFLFFCLSIFSCVSNKKFQQIKFGEGGGVTGKRTEYTINSKGVLFKKASQKSDIQKTGKVPKSQLKEIAKKSEDFCKLDTLFNPGNYYYFIEIQMKTCNKKFVWSTSSRNNTSNLAEFYSLLNKTIPKK
jgi:hypothetical protein